MKNERSIITYLIVKEWLYFFLGAAIILFILITASTIISGLLRQNVTSSDVIFNYLIELPTTLSRVFPVACLTASLFSINKLKDRNELAAIFSSGFSRKKFIQIIAAISSVVALMQFISLSFVHPLLKDKKENFITNSEAKFRNLKSKGLKASTIGSGKIWVKAKDYFLSFSAYSKQERLLRNIEVYYFNEDSLHTRKIKATSATYEEGTGWFFHDVVQYKDINLEEFAKPQIIDSMLVHLDEKPKDFDQFESDITTLNAIELYKYIIKLKDLGISVNEYEVLFLNKFSSSFICIIFALLAATSIFNPNRRSSSFGKNVAMIFVFTLGFWLISSYSTELGQNGKLSPYIAIFSVPLFFIFILISIFIRNRKLRS